MGFISSQYNCHLCPLLHLYTHTDTHKHIHTQTHTHIRGGYRIFQKGGLRSAIRDAGGRGGGGGGGGAHFRSDTKSRGVLAVHLRPDTKSGGGGPEGGTGGLLSRRGGGTLYKRGDCNPQTPPPPPGFASAHTHTHTHTHTHRNKKKAYNTRGIHEGWAGDHRDHMSEHLCTHMLTMYTGNVEVMVRKAGEEVCGGQTSLRCFFPGA